LLTKTVKVISEYGIHMKPCALIVDVAQEYNSDIIINKRDGTKGDAKSMLDIAIMAIAKGEELSITADGIDEDEAVDALIALIQNDFDKILTE